MGRKFFFAFLVIGFSLLTNILVGRNDVLSILLMIVVALLMKPVILEFQMGGRQLMANQFNDRSDVKPKVQPPGFLSHVLAVLGALMISIGLMVLVKGIILSHGLISFVALLFVMTLALFPILGKSESTFVEGDAESSKPSDDSFLGRHLVPSASRYAAFVASLVVAIIILNIIMAFLLSAKDTFIFLASEVTVDNFDEIAVASAIPFNEHNTFSRAIINVYILADTFRLAVANSIFDVFVPSGNKERFFYLFYFVVLLLNLIKLVPFSVGIVVFLRGVRRHSDQAQAWTTKKYRKIEPHLVKGWSKASDLLSKNYAKAKSSSSKRLSAPKVNSKKESTK